MILPNFLILGAAKAGTTALYHYLRQHPEIGLSRIKETNYLALRDQPLDFRGPGDDVTINRFSTNTESGYYHMFDHCEGKKAVGEATPLYLYDPRVPAAIREVVPDARMVAILRNPVDRAFSAFLHLVRDRRETTDDFVEGLRLEPERIADRWEHIWHYVAMGRYAEQLARYYEVFPRDQIRVYLYRDFRRDPDGLVANLLRFLEVDPSFRPDQTERHNASLPHAPRPHVPPEARRIILQDLRSDTEHLETLLGRDLSDWMK